MKTATLALVVAALLPVFARAEASAPASIRVLTYNIHHGEGQDKKLDLNRIAATILSTRADIVALQEVDRGVERSGRRDLPAELAALTGMEVHFERNIAHQGGDYGNAVLTRFPIRERRNLHFAMNRPGEQRGALQVTLDVGGRELVFLSTHLDARRDDAERIDSVDQLRSALASSHGRPVILCGDFNDTPGSRTHAKLKSFLTDAWEAVGHGPGATFPAHAPANRIDYIWIAGATIAPLSIAVPDAEGSDHLPVLAEFRLQ